MRTMVAGLLLAAVGCTEAIAEQTGEAPHAGASPGVTPGRPGPPGAPLPGVPSPGSPPGEPTQPPPPGAPGPAAPVSTTRLARLSHVQWENATRDLLRLPQRPGLAAKFRGDAHQGRFDNAGGLLSIDETLRRDYREAAEQLAERVTRDPAALRRLVPAAPDAAARTRAFVESFGLRAFRRPLGPAEISRYVALAGKGAASYGGADAFADGVRLLIESFLQSPHFLYRTELGPGAPGPRPLGAYEHAARLSFALTGSVPDDQLLAAAAAGELTTAAAVRRHAERLLDRPEATEMLESFHAQPWRTSTYELIEKDARTFPEFVPGLGADMRRETLSFARDVVARGSGLREPLLTARSFVNRRLAPIYGVQPPAGDAFAPVDLDPARRAGFLTHAGFLASTAHSREVDSIHRGVLVHLNVPCTALPPPVDGVSLSGAKGRTNRERITSVTGPGTCGSGCHSTVINPVGFAFEAYDAIGRFRTTDADVPVDAAGAYVFDGVERSWTDAVGFIRLVAESQAAHDCYSRALFEYLHGRVPVDEDERAWRRLGARSRADRAATRALVLDLVSSDDFLTRWQ